jgi:hypothetical protein
LLGLDRLREFADALAAPLGFDLRFIVPSCVALLLEPAIQFAPRRLDTYFGLRSRS